MSSKSPALALAQIGQIAVPVTDIDRAVAFYRDVLAMKLLFQAPPAPPSSATPTATPSR